jgi:sugar/nucleoside kinase (ribokinase family)
MYISIGSIIIDDIVLPNGKTQMGMFGGGSTHAIAGMRVWADSVGVVAWVGNNFPLDMAAALEKDFDIRGIIRREEPSPRAWQVFEEDGKRTEIIRTDFSQFITNSPQPTEIPLDYRSAKGVHLECDVTDFHQWIEMFRSHGTEVILWEPWDYFCAKENLGVFQEFMPLVDGVSPNLLEARRLTGLDDPVEIAWALLKDGAQRVVLRMGSEGSLVAEKNGKTTFIPAVQVPKIVDVTGAGNAYCGGFIVGLAETGDVVHAACCGAVSASFALAQFGAIYPWEDVREQAQERLFALKNQIA